MPNRNFPDVRELRKRVESLIDQGKFRVTYHAKTDHPEISEADKVAIVRWGGRDQADQTRPPGSGVYVCWLRHPNFGLCRGVYAVERTAYGDFVVVITAFQE